MVGRFLRDIIARCTECGAPATAGRIFTSRNACLECAALESVELPMSGERLEPVNGELVGGPAWAAVSGIAQDGCLWSHQARALNRLAEGRNVVVATPTASGKSQVFMLWALHLTQTQPRATVIAFYPTKALVNDQLSRWERAAHDAGAAPGWVVRVDGDVPVQERDRLVENSRIVVATPDVCHAWLLRNQARNSPAKFLANLRLVISDEAHVYENVFGSHACYMLRRLAAAVMGAGAKGPPQHVAATATIRDPAGHLEKLTGLEFTAVTEEDNGAPRHERKLLHLPLESNRVEDQTAQLIGAVLDADRDAQAIVFREYRQSVERIAQRANRPGEVVPYRSGYRNEDRKETEDRLRAGKVRAVVSTSALELGIDMPDLNYGIQAELPPSRKQFLQRLGRVGRSKPGTFVLLAERGAFQRLNDTLEGYWSGAVEPTHLYMENRYISYQEASCVKNELESLGRPTSAVPGGVEWPPGFEESLREAHGRMPPHFQGMARRSLGRSPQLAYGMRDSGEERLRILTGKRRDIGEINVDQALRETPPGAKYRHRGTEYRVKSWGRDPDSGTGLIRVEESRMGNIETKVIGRNVCLINDTPESVPRTVRATQEKGHVSLIEASLVTSAEGLRIEQDRRSETRMYRDEAAKDPRLSRKGYQFPTTALWIEIDEDWFEGDSGDSWRGRDELARGLIDMICYHRSIPKVDLRYLTGNVLARHSGGGYTLSKSSVVIYDNVYGGIGLAELLADEIEDHTARLVQAAAKGENTGYGAKAATRFGLWLKAAERKPVQRERDSGPSQVHLALRPGTEGLVYSETAGGMAKCRILRPNWRGRELNYVVEVEGEDGDRQVSGNSVDVREDAKDWVLWCPETGEESELDLYGDL